MAKGRKMILLSVILWLAIGWVTLAFWIYDDAINGECEYNLKQILGLSMVALVLGPIMVPLYIWERYGTVIKDFFEKPIIGGKK
jgi:hypothetical protein